MADFTEFPIPTTNIADFVADVEAAAAAADADAAATAADRVQTGLDATATAADRVQTGLDAAATAADAASTAADAAALGVIPDAIAVPCDVTGTANALILTPKTGWSEPAGERLYTFKPVEVNTSNPTVYVAGGARPLRFYDDTWVPAGWLHVGVPYVIQYNATTGVAYVVSPQPHYLDVVPMEDTGSTTATQLHLTDALIGAVVSSSRATYETVALFDRGVGVLGGMLAVINGAEMKNVLHPDGSAIEPGTFFAGDTLSIGQLDVSINAYPLLSPAKPVAAVSITAGPAQRLAEIRFSSILEGLS